MRHSVLDAIKSGDWNYEPEDSMSDDGFDSTLALPGSDQKLEILVERIRSGLPLWHNSDCYDHSPAGETVEV